MNFAQQQADPRRRIVGFGAVLLFHLLIVYALVSGLAKKVVDVVRAPIETKVIEEIKKPPPPPEIVVPPPPKLEAPPPPFIPPPEIQIATPPPPAPTITATTQTPPPAPVVIAPTPPVAAAPAPPAPPAPTTASAGVVCSNYATVMGDVAYPARSAAPGHRARRGGDPVHPHRRGRGQGHQGDPRDPSDLRSQQHSHRQRVQVPGPGARSRRHGSVRLQARVRHCRSRTDERLHAIHRQKESHAAYLPDLGANRDDSRLAGPLRVSPCRP